MESTCLCIHNCDYASLCKAIQLVIPSILSTAAVIQRVYFLFDLTKIKIFSQWSIKLSEQSFPRTILCPSFDPELAVFIINAKGS